MIHSFYFISFLMGFIFYVSIVFYILYILHKVQLYLYDETVLD